MTIISEKRHPAGPGGIGWRGRYCGESSSEVLFAPSHNEPPIVCRGGIEDESRLYARPFIRPHIPEPLQLTGVHPVVV